MKHAFGGHKTTMSNCENMKSLLSGTAFQERLLELYGEESRLPAQTKRYGAALDAFAERFGEDREIALFSAPGRTEICGNHTDHQNGKVLAASLNLDVIAVVEKTEDPVIVIRSAGFPEDRIDLSDLSRVPEETGTSAALIRGVAAYLSGHGHRIGGFRATTTSEVLKGSGMSSSAAFEVLVGTILSGLYNDMSLDPVELALASQYAENVYFGKPSGLMDQMACAVGGLIRIDFKDPGAPVVSQIPYAFSESGHALCIVDTRGSHADLTPDYAAVPEEMRKVARSLGKEVLRDVPEEDFYRELPNLRKRCGDRAVLRALHFFQEEHRVDDMTRELKQGNFEAFLSLVRASGDSSYKYLQNVISCHKLQEQGIPIGLATAEAVLQGTGACRVHGGGFAGTIQAYVPNEKVDAFRVEMDRIFGEGSCYPLKIRPYGGVKVID